MWFFVSQIKKGKVILPMTGHGNVDIRFKDYKLKTEKLRDAELNTIRTCYDIM